MSTTLMTEPAAGWYHDPADAGAMRWWDGATWTDHVRPMAEAPVTAPVDTGAAQAGPARLGPAPLAPEPFAPVQVAPAEPEPAPAHYQPVPTHAPVFDQIPAPAAEPEPVAEAPAPEPVQVGPESIPQPGQVAPAPPAAAGGVPMTPSTPVSDQLYWHSSAAEVVEVPRISTQASRVGPRSAVHAPSYVRDWNDLGSPNTPGVWLLALWPLLGVGLSILVQVAMGFAGVTGLVPPIVAGVTVLLLGWIFASMDARALAERGYHRPRLAWMLLFPPLAYLIARGKQVRRERKGAWGPELVFILSFLAVGGAGFVAGTMLSAVLLAGLPIAP